MTEKERFLFHKAVIQPNIDYVAVACSSLNITQNQRLHWLKKKAVRVITNSSFKESSKALLQHLRFADFECRHMIQLAKFTDKATSDLQVSSSVSGLLTISFTVRLSSQFLSHHFSGGYHGQKSKVCRTFTPLFKH